MSGLQEHRSDQEVTWLRNRDKSMLGLADNNDTRLISELRNAEGVMTEDACSLINIFLDSILR